MHYRRWHAGKPMGDARTDSERKAERVCVVDGCENRGKLVRGMCANHYRMWHRRGTTERLAPEPGSVRVEREWFNGVEFRRYPDSPHPNHQRYFSPGGADIERGVESLHREVWKFHRGPIPPGMHVHHVDGDYGNNAIENLELLPAGAHARHHHPKGRPASDAQRAHLHAVRHLAANWHRSPEGREWHSRHAKAIWAKRKGMELDDD